MSKDVDFDAVANTALPLAVQQSYSTETGNEPFLVSVIIPAYNYGRYLRQAVESVLNGSYSRFEILIIDNGSTDNTPDVGKALAQQDHRIRYFCYEKLGLSKARNVGAQHAQGELLAFLDADDYWHPEKLAVAVEYLLMYPDRIKATGSAVQPFYEGNIKARTKAQTVRPCTLEELDAIQNSAQIGCVFPSTLVCFKDVFHSLGGFREDWSTAEDTEFTVRLEQQYGLIASPKPLVYYRVHSSSMTNNTFIEKRLRTLLLIENKQRQLQSQPLIDINDSIDHFKKRPAILNFLKYRTIYGDWLWFNSFINRKLRRYLPCVGWMILSFLIHPGLLFVRIIGVLQRLKH